jgi:hypothetical protein
MFLCFLVLGSLIPLVPLLLFAIDIFLFILPKW